MKFSKIQPCHICGTKFNICDDYCPRCGWFYIGYERELDPDEYEEHNTMTINEAKSKYKKGLNIWGEPLPNMKK